MTDIDEKRLREIEGRAAGATPGPWVLTEDRRYVLCDVEPICTLDAMVAERDCDTAEFVARSREDVHDLCRLARRHFELVRALRELIDECHDGDDSRLDVETIEALLNEGVKVDE